MPCNDDYRKNIVVPQARRERDGEFDPNEALWQRLFQKVHGKDGGCETFTPAEEAYWYVSVLDGEVFNGGVEQFYFNSSGDDFSQTEQALREIGAVHALRLLQRSARVLFGDATPPRDQDERNKAISAYWDRIEAQPDLHQDELALLSMEYCKDTDDINRLLEAYARATGLIETGSD